MREFPPLRAGWVVLVIPETVAELRLQRRLNHRLAQPGEQPALADQLHTLLTRPRDKLH